MVGLKRFYEYFNHYNWISHCITTWIIMQMKYLKSTVESFGTMSYFLLRKSMWFLTLAKAIILNVKWKMKWVDFRPYISTNQNDEVKKEKRKEREKNHVSVPWIHRRHHDRHGTRSPHIVSVEMKRGVIPPRLLPYWSAILPWDLAQSWRVFRSLEMDKKLWSLKRM